MKINGWIKASSQWKKDVPQPVAILIHYSQEACPGPAGSCPLLILQILGKAVAVSRLDFMHAGPSLEGSQTVAGLGELPSYC